MLPTSELAKVVGERFEVGARLGAGSFGEVWEAHDHLRDAPVALKLLTRLEPEALYSFKREFRSLADLVHPNLVTLYELFSREDAWFFTMARIRGKEFLDRVGRWDRHHAPEPAESEATLPSDRYSRDSGSSDTTVRRGRGRPVSTRGIWRVDFDRLRPALAQLAAGVQALHDAGKLHRDLKPSNVLVESDGRVVVLDFGLVSDRRIETEKSDPVGTPAYMAPEQAEGHSSPASDWYSVGVMLFEALTGRQPFEGKPLAVLLERLSRDPPSPDSLVDGLPVDLSRLCLDLLQRDPAARPDGPGILAQLSVPQESARQGVPIGIGMDEPVEVFVGREDELGVLAGARQSTLEHRPAAVFIHGASGIGKTALIRRYLDTHVGQASLVLQARCYEQESLPFKAIDGVVDALSRYLAGLDRGTRQELLPLGFEPLAQLFPVLAGAVSPRRPGTDPGLEEHALVTRRRAVNALRELLRRIAAEHPLVLYIDDLQWGDADSAWLMTELLRPPEPPALLLLGSYRQEGPENPMVAELSLLHEREAAFGTFAVLELPPLPDRDAKHLARRLATHPIERSGVDPAALVREAGGNPFFIGELLHQARRSRHEGASPERIRSSDSSRGRALDQLIQDRVSELTDSARQLLEIIAIAGQPLERRVVTAAALTRAEEGPPSSAVLRTERLIRATAGDRVEVYHDRIRQAVLGRIDPERRLELHRDLAQTLETHRPEDVETLAVHFDQAGERAKAGRYAETAARRAAEGLAFDHAARLYRLAITNQTVTGPGAGRLWSALGEALANGGRGDDAAQAFLRAATLVSGQRRRQRPRQALELTQRAGEQLLRCGQVDQGLTVLGQVTEALGLGTIPAPWQAMAGFLARRAFLRLRGLGFRERAAAAIPEDELLRLDTLWSLALGLAQADPIRGASYQAAHLVAALRLGEPTRIARALSAEVAYTAMMGWQNRERSAAVLQQALAVVDRLDSPKLRAQTLLSAGIAEYLFGHWKECLRYCEEAEAQLSEHGVGVSWELAEAHVYVQSCLFHTGQLRRAMERHPEILAQARDRNDRFAEVACQIAGTYAFWMIRDDPDGGLRIVDELFPQGPARHGRIEHWWALIARVQLNLYAGRGGRAWEHMQQQWPGLKRSLLLRVPMVRLQTQMIRVHAALAAAREVAVGSRRPFLRVVEQGAREFARNATPFAELLPPYLHAALALHRGDASRALDLMARSEQGFAHWDTPFFAAALRYWRGRIMGGHQGEELIREGRKVFAREGALDPDRMISALVPDPRPTS